ncbi:hypothetical protein K8R43_02915 [archaeon]|nr:hypothetical protein [archaeon]
MTFLVALVVSVLVRFVALFVVFWKTDVDANLSFVSILAVFSALMSFLMPVEVTGFIFRLVLLAVMFTILFRLSVGNAFLVVFLVALLEAVIIFAFSMSPLAFLVSGINVLSVP